MRISHGFAVALAAMLLLLRADGAAAATRIWVDGNGSWSDPGNWSPFGVPGGGDDVYITNFTATGRTIFYDYSGFPTILGSLNLGLIGGAGATETLEMRNSTLNCSVEVIGTSGGLGNGSGTLNQTTGSNIVGAGGLYLGSSPTDEGFYNLSAGSLSTSGYEHLGWGNSSTATFTQTGGTNNVTSGSVLEIAAGISSTASYKLSGGSLTVAGAEVVGSAGGGTFNHSGGSNTLNSGGHLYVGYSASATGAYTLGGTGTLSVAGNEYIGYSGAGTFEQSAGSNTANSSLYLGFSTNSSGAYGLSAGTLSTSGFEFVGYSGTGTFNHSGGTNSMGLTLYLGYNAGSSGAYNLSGNGSVSPGANELVGDFGVGTFNQSGGTNTIPLSNSLYLGYAPGSSGTYTLTSGTLTNNGFEYIGNNGAGTFIQTGGTHFIKSDLVLGQSNSASGAFSLADSGALTVLGSQYVGYSGTGTFTQTGGTNQLGIGSSLFVGYNANSSGTYTLAGGLLSLPGNGNEYIGASGAGVFNHSAGINSPSKSVYIGLNAGATGTYNLSGAGVLSVNNVPLYIGYSGTGAFVQSGGSNAVNSASLYVAYNSGTTGSYALSGGSFVLSGLGMHEFIGYGDNSTASFTQSGGTNQINGAPNNLYVGYGAGAVATYNLSGGSILLAGNLIIGVSGVGTMTVSDSGQVTVGKTLQISQGSALNLNGGRINTAALYFGATPGLFNWTTGTLNFTSDMTWDPSVPFSTPASFGPTLTLADGQTLMVSGNETLGGTAPFSLELGSGSSHIVAGSLTVSPTGTLTLDDGGSLIVYSSFNQSGGSVIGNLLVSGPFAYSGGAFSGQLISQSAATFSANFTAPGGMENDGTLTISGPRTLTFNGPGLDNFGAITLAAGQTITGTAVVNDVGGVISSSGTIAAPFTNLGTLSENATSGTILVTGAMVNYGYVGPITSGVSFRPTGGLDNAGTIQLNGGSISGAGSVVNDFGGLIQSGVGASTGVVASGVSAPLTNSGGVIVASSNTILNLTSFAGGNVNGGELRIQNAATLNSPLAFPNSGTVLLQGPAATIAGGALANTGTISGLGRVSNAVDNAGVIQAVGGTLTLSAAGCTNDAATDTNPDGQIQAGAGAAIIFSQGLATNAGTIALSGGTFDNNNRLMTNASTGFIIGAGTFRSGGLTNNGTVRFADSPTSVFGTLTTASPGSVVNLINNTTTFFGPVTIADDSSLITDNATARFLATLSGSVTSQLAINGALKLSGVSGVYGKVANQGQVNVAARANASFYGPFAGAGSVVNSGSLTFNSAVTTNNIGGTLTDNSAATLVVTGGGALEIDSPPTLGDSSSILVTSNSRLKFNVQSGAATIGTGVTAIINASATLELAGSVSALASAANRVNITNNSTAAAGILVSGTSQVVGNIDGTGTTQVNAGCDLTANQIVQGALVIGGSVGSPALVTIAASDGMGNPLGQMESSAIAAEMLDPPMPTTTRLPPAIGGNEQLLNGSTFSLDGEFDSAFGQIPSRFAVVPEPATIVLIAVAAVVCGIHRWLKLQRQQFGSWPCRTPS